MKSKASAAVVAILVAVGAYWYWSPVLALKQMQSASKAGDADTFNDHVDYPKLRESFKGQLSAMFTGGTSTQPSAGNEAARAGTALGNMLGLALVDKMVDAFVRPEVVMRAMQEGKMMPQRGLAGSAPQEPVAQSEDSAVWTSERVNVNKYIAFVAKPEDAPEKRVGLVLERSGFASWRLTEIRLPR